MSIVGGLLPVANISNKGLMAPLQFNLNDKKDIQNLGSDDYYKICSINTGDAFSLKFLVVRGSSITVYSIMVYYGNSLIIKTAKNGDDSNINIEFYYVKNGDKYDLIYRRNLNHAGSFKLEVMNNKIELYNEKLPGKPSEAVLIPIK